MTESQAMTAAEISDEALVAKLADGDTDAGEELARRYREAMVRYCYAYLDRYEDAEDAAQDVLATLTAGANLPEGRVKPWLYRVARNRCLNLLARRMDAREGAGSVVRDSRWGSPRTGPRTAALRAEARERVRQVLAEMSDEHRDVLILRYFEGLRRKEIAEVLCVAETVVRSRLYRASMKLREALGETEAQS